MEPCIVCKKESEGKLGHKKKHYPLCEDCFWNDHKALDRIQELEQQLEDEIGMREVVGHEVQELRQEVERLRGGVEGDY